MAERREFLGHSRLPDDGDARTMRDLGNRSIVDYVLNVDVPRRAAVDVDFMTRNPNMRARDGVGFCDPDHIDTDSKLRLDSGVTHTRSRIPLQRREFVAAPDYRSVGAGGDEYRAAHRLPPGERAISTDEPLQTPQRQAKRETAETDFARLRLTPLLPTMREFIANDVPLSGSFSIGEPSRDVLRRSGGTCVQPLRA